MAENMKEGRKLWTKDELVLAFNLYLKLPFGKLHSSNPEIIRLARLLNRTPGSVAMRLNNFASIDPYHQQRGVKGLDGGKKKVMPIWEEFIEDRERLLFESEKILARLENTSLEKKFHDKLTGTELLKGEEKIREVKTRVNQSVFRSIVMANYEFKCCISGIDLTDLLLASHIIPWSKNEKERLNPENGICLSPLYDRAFDKGLIGISTNFEILISRVVKNNNDKAYYSEFFAPIEGRKITMPKKYIPRKEFLEYHLDAVYIN
jgi:putative restriction endonuclease